MPFDDLAGVAINDLGRLGDEYSHRDDAAFTHDHALYDLRARPDKAVVADDRRVCLHRLKNAANPGASGDMAIGATTETCQER